uniref:Uncharacterized protein n=1 Tax=Romanomermis culicivorax TaxID=13658 RepID=A0A915L2I0_ROMCU
MVINKYTTDWRIDSPMDNFAKIYRNFRRFFYRYYPKKKPEFSVRPYKIERWNLRSAKSANNRLFRSTTANKKVNSWLEMVSSEYKDDEQIGDSDDVISTSSETLLFNCLWNNCVTEANNFRLAVGLDIIQSSLPLLVFRRFSSVIFTGVDGGRAAMAQA